jgi:hypothetical protein|uniref:Uncharacterized protein n=1 Tax=viral metagenome TaxID=1070528 RepID=A0A6C0JSY9_9ZZZZ
MGGLISKTNQQLNQEFFNNIVQTNQQYCVAETTSDIGTSVVIVSDGTIGGDFTGIEYATNTDASCLMVSSMEANVSTILQASAEQTDTSETDIFSLFGNYLFNMDKETVYQSVTNDIYQINEAVCQSSTTTSTAGQYVYVTNEQIGGDFLGVSLSSDTSSNCTMNNMMKLTTYNQGAAEAEQDILDEGMFATFFNSLVSIIVAVVVVVIVVALVSVALAFAKKPKSSGAQAGQPGTVTLAV